LRAVALAAGISRRVLCDTRVIFITIIAIYITLAEKIGTPLIRKLAVMANPGKGNKLDMTTARNAAATKIKIVLHATAMTKGKAPAAMMRTRKTQLCHSVVTFYGVVPGHRQAKSLGSITLKVAFGDENNFREEPVTFEVVPFKSTYHMIFGRPAFHSFHARPCYIYNQLKMPGLDGIITVYGSFRKAKECKEGKAAFIEAVFFSEEFKEIHATTDPMEMPVSKPEVSTSPPTFKPIVDTKQVELVAGDAAKTTSI
jgi:hypothetical protein